MGFPALKIEASSPNASTKTRTFSVHLLGYLAADVLWEPGGNGSAERPVWATDRLDRRHTDQCAKSVRNGARGGPAATP